MSFIPALGARVWRSESSFQSVQFKGSKNFLIYADAIREKFNDGRKRGEKKKASVVL